MRPAIVLLLVCLTAAQAKVLVHKVTENPSCDANGDKLDCGERLRQLEGVKLMACAVSACSGSFDAGRAGHGRERAPFQGHAQRL